MYRKELNKRSPMRLFERSTHGGLGRGNVGLVTSRPGVGKSAVLVGFAMDDLLRDRKVLHVSFKEPATKVREFYDEVFHDLAETEHLENRANSHLRMERNRMIHCFRDSEGFDVGKLRVAMGYMKEHMEFEPFALILDGYPDFMTATEADLAEVKQLATDLNAEVWVSAKVTRDEARDDRGLPTRFLPVEAYLDVIVDLQPESDHVKLRLMKDHESKDLADLHIELEPKTLLLKWR